MFLGKLVIYETHDETDCETCGASWEEGYEIDYNGKTYGTSASASCFGSEGCSFYDALEALMNDYNCGDDFDLIPHMSNSDVVAVLCKLGFEVNFIGAR